MSEFKQVHWQGSLDMSTVAELVSLVEKMLGAGDSVEVDLSQVEFVDSTGIGGLLNLLQAAPEHGVEIRFVQIQPEVLEILEIMGVADLFAGT